MSIGIVSGVDSSTDIISPSYTVNTALSGVNYNPSVWTTSDSFTIGSAVTPGLGQMSAGKLSLNGDNADIEINGESLVSMLKRIEERINLLTVNHELEAEWDELRELGNQYRELEQHIKKKMETWQKLKAQDTDNR